MLKKVYILVLILFFFLFCRCNLDTPQRPAKAGSASSFNIYGDWEIVDSVLQQPWEYESSVQPFDPIANGQLVEISDSTFCVGSYSVTFENTEYTEIDWQFLEPYRLTAEAQSWITDKVPYKTVYVGLSDSSNLYWRFPKVGILEVDDNTIIVLDMPQDGWYAYELTRII